mmetsp:Transcript_30302/g.92598  ORF Transcript_30302/g.92598 Transcript_30302/m.92598 type:complete len:175 (+) Transcript_30302:3205-3729(+)
MVLSRELHHVAICPLRVATTNTHNSNPQGFKESFRCNRPTQRRKSSSPGLLVHRMDEFNAPLSWHNSVSCLMYPFVNFRPTFVSYSSGSICQRAWFDVASRASSNDMIARIVCNHRASNNTCAVVAYLLSPCTQRAEAESRAAAVNSPATNTSKALSATRTRSSYSAQVTSKIS